MPSGTTLKIKKSYIQDGRCPGRDSKRALGKPNQIKRVTT